MVGVARPDYNLAGKGCVLQQQCALPFTAQRELRGPVTISLSLWLLARCPLLLLLSVRFLFLFNFIWSSRQLTDGWLLVACTLRTVYTFHPPTLFYTDFIMQKFLWRNFPLAACTHVMIMKESFQYDFFLKLFLSLRSPKIFETSFASLVLFFCD